MLQANLMRGLTSDSLEKFLDGSWWNLRSVLFEPTMKQIRFLAVDLWNGENPYLTQPVLPLCQDVPTCSKCVCTQNW